MIARNVVSSAATRAGYGLAVARTVGRNSAALRRAMFDRDGWLTGLLNAADCRTLNRACLTVGTPRRVQLTDAGRALAARL